MGSLNGWHCRLAAVQEAAEWRKRTFKFQREEPEKSRVNGGNTNELSERRTERKE